MTKCLFDLILYAKMAFNFFDLLTQNTFGLAKQSLTLPNSLSGNKWVENSY